jgi:hypothetical protein
MQEPLVAASALDHFNHTLRNSVPAEYAAFRIMDQVSKATQSIAGIRTLHRKIA